MNVFELINERLEKASKLYSLNEKECEFAIRQDIALSIVDEAAKEYAKTPTPMHPIPIDTQQYIEELEKQIEKCNWVPCSERLPSDCAIHEVTAQFSNGKIYTEFAYYDDSREEWWKFDDDGLVNVLAWKEHSEPYKEGGTDNA